MTTTSLIEKLVPALESAGRTVSAFTGVDVSYGVPQLTDTPIEHETVTAIHIRYGDESGDTTLVMDPAVRDAIVAAVLPDQADDEDMAMSALGEMVNQLLAGLVHTLPDLGATSFGTPVPEIVAPDELAAGTHLEWPTQVGDVDGTMWWILSEPALAALSAPAMDSDDAVEPGAAPRLGNLSDVQLDVTVELGRSRVSVRDLLSLDEGGVIKLGRPVGEPVDLLVNGTRTARGEIVVVDGRLGVRITELVG